MRTYIIIFASIAILLAGYVVWPTLHPYMGQIKIGLIGFKRFCHENPIEGYVVFGLLLAMILFLGLPFAMAVMLMAGITYDFWEAAMLVTICRMMVAVSAFQLVRHMVDHSLHTRPQPVLIRKFERHPRFGLLLARLSPLPDTTVNYVMGASSLDCVQYTIISLIGMIPLTVLCVWAGNQLGSVTQLIKVLN